MTTDKDSDQKSGGETKQTSFQGLDLGILNRHWYRRCLDQLDYSLQEAGSNPTVDELERVADGVVTRFLKSVVSQAPDSDMPQFPADRAYFIPFEGGRTSRFDFAKPYFQMLQRPPVDSEGKEPLGEDHDGSLWSFLPWWERTVRIDAKSSIGENQETKLFGDLISPREIGIQSLPKESEVPESPQATDEPVPTPNERRADDAASMRFKKALLLCAQEANPLNDPGFRQWLTQREFRNGVKAALVDLFDIYRMALANPELELLLLMHYQVLSWLASLSGLSSAAKDSTSTRQRDESKQLMVPLLESYFFGPAAKATLVKERELLDLTEKWWQRLTEEWRREEEQLTRDSSRNTAPTGDASGKLGSKTDKFVQALKQFATDEDTKNKRTKFRDVIAVYEGEDKEEQALAELIPHFKSFHDNFLSSSKIEENLEESLDAFMRDDPRRAGITAASFVWVCPDFEDFKDALQKPSLLDGSVDVKELRKLLNNLNKPYREFFRRLESVSLLPFRTDLGNYWRIRGQASRAEKIFASHDERGRGPSTGLTLPPRAVLQRKPDHLKYFPQNIFLRVCIRDSLNEPFVDGLFIFSTDYDEVSIWQKDSRVRSEDVQDLLSFAKVFFFTVRDHVHGLDRARDTADIGRLNQYLFDRRLSELTKELGEQLKAKDITDKESWSELAYVTLNNYGQALLDKLADVRSETFPYDRLLIIPLDEDVKEDAELEYALPFFLFQSVYVECFDDKIQGDHYSFIKPFQSPIQEEERSFFARTFQREYQSKGKVRKLKNYLEKLYVGARGPTGNGAAGKKPPSYTLKSHRNDNGSEWSRQALRDFWEETVGDKIGAKALLDFLSSLTEQYRDLIERRIPESDLPSAQLWFLLRFGFLRNLLTEIDENDSKLKRLRSKYHREELILRFGDEDRLDILWLAGGPGKSAKERKPGDRAPDPYFKLKEINRKVSLGEDPLTSVKFFEYHLREQDRFMLEWFYFLTRRAMNKRSKLWSDFQNNEDQGQTGQDESALESENEEWTWYQPELTRPLDSCRLRSAEAIDSRIPNYGRIAQGDDALAMFLGAVELRIGRSERERRSLTCVIAMIRDYDDTKYGGILSEKDIRDQLDEDLGDLSLFTNTFFNNALRVLTTARERQQIRVLTTDINAIARNWYSEGIDIVNLGLQQQLQSMLKDSGQMRLGQLRMETITSVFDLMVKKVMLREEQSRATGEPIRLESFPFDRVIHVPLLFGTRNAASLSYLRTTLKTQSEGELPYTTIRTLGRHYALGRGNKVAAFTIHIGSVHEEGRRPIVTLELNRNGEKTSIREILEDLADPERTSFDVFIRRLYRADTLQSLTVGGVFVHLLGLAEHYLQKQVGIQGSAPDSAKDLERLRLRVEMVLKDSIRSIERDQASLRTKVHTDVHMDREVRLRPLADELLTGDEAMSRLIYDEPGYLPLLFDLFRAAEKDSREFLHGLGEEVASKAFYVYYSIPAPDGFVEQLEFGPRYRGVFCFLVDDASTDDKKEQDTEFDSGNATQDYSIAEIADQEDIRTFVHNMMGSLKLVLDQQALEHRIQQPGVEDFVNGLLHRLKNELNEPVKALEACEEAIRLHSTKERERQKLINRVQGARSSIVGVSEIFYQLRDLSESRRGVNPMQKVSSSDLGWRFVRDLCVAARKAVQDAGDKDDPALLQIEAIDRKVSDRMRSSDRDGGAGQRVQRALYQMGTLIEDFVARLEGSKEPVEFLLSYEVFSSTPLVFRGSHRLPEALNILAENAFQAAWAYALKASSKVGNDLSPTVRIAFTCRHSDEQSNEIILEIQNSTLGLSQEFLKVLNAEIPQPISARRYNAASARKKGGSGFGHYFARRIISEFCGGRAARRQLDVRIDSPDIHTARVRVNLLQALSREPSVIPAQFVMKKAVEVFQELQKPIERDAVALEKDDACLIPGEIAVPELCKVTRTMLRADQRLKEDSLMSFVSNELFFYLEFQTDWLRDCLIERLRQRTKPIYKKMLKQLRVSGTVRQGSFHDLRDLIEMWCKVHSKDLRNLVKDDSTLSKLLDPCIQKGVLQPMDLLTEHQRQDLDKGYAAFEPFLRPESKENGNGFYSLLKDLSKDDGGRPRLADGAVSALLTNGTWEYMMVRNGSRLRLAFRLRDTEGDGKWVKEAEERNGQLVNVLNSFRKEPMAYTFASYQAAFRERPCGALDLVRNSLRESSASAIDVGYRTIYLDLSLVEHSTREEKSGSKTKTEGQG